MSMLELIFFLKKWIFMNSRQTQITLDFFKVSKKKSLNSFDSIYFF